MAKLKNLDQDGEKHYPRAYTPEVFGFDINEGGRRILGLSASKCLNVSYLDDWWV